VSGTLDLDWIALSDEDRVSSGSASLVAKHALLLAVGARYRRLRSSMLAAIERGRPPAVDFLNGEVVQRADALGLSAPVNSILRDTIHQLAKKERKPSHDLLRAIFDATRAHVAPPRETMPIETRPTELAPEAIVPGAPPPNDPPPAT
jgi:2-dehydropantoate 2-reductase